MGRFLMRKSCTPNLQFRFRHFWCGRVARQIRSLSGDISYAEELHTKNLQFRWRHFLCGRVAHQDLQFRWRQFQCGRVAHRILQLRWRHFWCGVAHHIWAIIGFRQSQVHGGSLALQKTWNAVAGRTKWAWLPCAPGCGLSRFCCQLRMAWSC